MEIYGNILLSLEETKYSSNCNGNISPSSPKLRDTE